MIQISEANLKAMSIHKVGNKFLGSNIVLSNSHRAIMSENLQSALMSYFFSSFKGDAFFGFTHPSSLMLNEVYASCFKIFENSNAFDEESKKIAKHLYEMQDNPRIKDGDLYVALISDVIVGTEVCDAIGIFKQENKDPYLATVRLADEFFVDVEMGIDIRKLDKGCLVFNTEREAGFKVCAIDNTNRNGEAVYWKEAFLRIKQREDSYYHTSRYIDVCKSFVKDVFNSENNVDPADQALMLCKSAEFFKTNEVFNEEVFEAEVMEQPEIIEAFQDYKEKYGRLNGINLSGKFDISSDVAKNASKQLKSVIKLDKNFHLYVHGKGMIERGYDEQVGKNFYKVYFDSEQ